MKPIRSNNCPGQPCRPQSDLTRISSSLSSSRLLSGMHQSNDLTKSIDAVGSGNSQQASCKSASQHVAVSSSFNPSRRCRSANFSFSSSAFCFVTSSPMLRKSRPDQWWSLVGYRMALFSLLALSSCLSLLHMVACDKIFLPTFLTLPSLPLSSSSIASSYAPYSSPSYPTSHHPSPECELNANAMIDQLLARMKVNLLKEKIVVQNGAITIYDASIVRISDLFRLTNSCARKLDSVGSRVLIPFQAEIRSPHAAAKLKYNAYVADIYGDYRGNFSHIRMNGTLEAHLHEEEMLVNQFNITSSSVISDSIVFGYVPRWILDWVRSYFDNDNTQLYQQLAHTILQREVDNFRDYDLIRNMFMQSMTSVTVQGREEEERLPQNRL